MVPEIKAARMIKKSTMLLKKKKKGSKVKRKSMPMTTPKFLWGRSGEGPKECGGVCRGGISNIDK